MQRHVLLALAVKAMKDRLGPQGIVPSALVFGAFLGLYSFWGPIVHRSSLAERALAAHEARHYTAKHLAQFLVKRVLQHQNPQATDQNYQSGDKGLVWREKLVEKRIGEWTGTYVAFRYEASARIILVQKESESPQEPYNVAKARPFLRRATAASTFRRSSALAINQITTPPQAVPIRFYHETGPGIWVKSRWMFLTTKTVVGPQRYHILVAHEPT